MMNKYQRFVLLVQMGLFALVVRGQISIQRAVYALDLATNPGPGSGLPTSVESWGITADGENNRIDTIPPAVMANEYLDWAAHKVSMLPGFIAHVWTGTELPAENR